MHGFWGRLLHVDLTSGRGVYRDLEEPRLRQYLGGIGLGTSLLCEYAPAGVDPLSPANPLILTSAPLVGTRLTTTAKFAVVTKSPLTGFIADSLSSSHFALELKRLGIDALVITGQAPALAYLFVDHGRVDIRNATHLRGSAPDETETRIRAELDSPAAWIASIGTAGENLVRFATISNEGRHAGRGGVGAVMGSKNLKAIAVCGDRATVVAEPEAVETIAGSLRLRSVGSLTDKYRRLGTVANLAVFNHLGALPTRNFQQATFEDAEALSGETLTGSSFSRRHGCASCTIQCERLFKSRTGNGEQRLEYETLFALGPLCGIRDPADVLDAAQLCDRYGLDTISTGGTLAWAIETGERGLLPGAWKLGLRFGNAQGVLSAIRAIAAREGIGELLAEGSRRAATETGGSSPDWAMHVKGLELPGYEPRSLKTMALGLAVSPRGACHNRSGAYEADFSGKVDRLRGDPQRGPLVAASEDFAAVLDSLIICKFLRKCFTDFYAEAAAIVSGVTGWDYTEDELRTAGERIHTVKKLFNIREQWQPADDWLPPRLLTEKLTSGVARGVGLHPEELRGMIQGYYQARGWDEAGFVPERKLEELGIASASESSLHGSSGRA
ncbi:MAG TPA: aldehyde ferredoxin oxidoreductase family protein [Vicinamibacterales bacterium]|nr:aldehyde ferredoxin oxidoreductase family protein [Vicinamibacterales bacterium]